MVYKSIQGKVKYWIYHSVECQTRHQETDVMDYDRINIPKVATVKLKI